MIDELRLSKGNDYILPNGIAIKSPTLGEIADYGENNYLSLISMFTATTIDRCAQLDDMGIDYTQITNFQMFILFSPLLTNRVSEGKVDCSILLGDIDFSSFKGVYEGDDIKLVNSDGVIFDEECYNLMAEYIRKMHGIASPQYTKVTDGFAKKQMIIDARNDAKYQEKLRALKGVHSVYQPYVSALVNHPYFKYNWETVWDIKISNFFDSLRRIQIIENANHLYGGLYSGCVEYSKIKKDLDWLRPIN